MKNTTRHLLTLLLVTAVFGSMACGGGETEAPAGETEPAIQQSRTPEAGPVEQANVAPGENFCNHLSMEDISSALGGKLELGASEGTETGCRIPVLFGVEGNALAYGQIPRGNYDAFKGYEDQSGVAFEYLEGLGQEAFVLNNAQVCVLMSETDAYLVGAQIMAVAEPLPISPEEMKAGLISLTTKLVSKL